MLQMSGCRNCSDLASVVHRHFCYGDFGTFLLGCYSQLLAVLLIPLMCNRYRFSLTVKVTNQSFPFCKECNFVQIHLVDVELLIKLEQVIHRVLKNIKR